MSSTEAHNETAAHQPVPGVPDAIQKTAGNVMDVSSSMLILTWMAFLIAAFILKKLLWKPIINAVEQREEEVSTALAGAKSAREEVAASEAKGRAVIAEAHAQAASSAEQAARNAALRARQAETDAQAYLAQKRADAAKRIEADRAVAVEALRKDAANHLTRALDLLLPELLTEEQKTAYQQRMAEKISFEEGSPA